MSGEHSINSVNSLIFLPPERFVLVLVFLLKSHDEFEDEDEDEDEIVAIPKS